MSEVKVDTISERTAANGVAVDGVTIKDSGLTIPSGGTATIASGGTLTVASGATITNSGTATGFGKVLQVVTATKTDTFSHNVASWVDVTGLSVTLTPTATSSKILLLSSNTIGTIGNSSYAYLRFHSSAAAGAVFVGDTAGSRTSLSWGGSSSSSTAIAGNTHFSYVDSPSTTSAVTYKLQFFSFNGDLGYINRTYDDIDSFGYIRGASSITALEIGA